MGVMPQLAMLATILEQPWTDIGAAAAGFAVALVQRPARALIARRRTIRRRRALLGERRLEADTIRPPDRPELREDLDEILDNLARDPIAGPRIYATQIQASDFRCFPQLDVSLNHPGGASELTVPNVTLVLGDNGAGKSTLLKGIAIAAVAPILDSSGFVPYHLIRSGHEHSSLRGSFIVDRPRQDPRAIGGAVRIEREGDYERMTAEHDRSTWSDLFEESGAAFLVLGYGVTRRAASDRSERAALERSSRLRRYGRVASLFDESAVLTPLSAWLPGLRPQRRREVSDLLAELLPAGMRLAEREAPEAIFSSRGQDVPYQALSDGYKSFIGWVGDLLFQIETAAEGRLPFAEVGGMVLVDEVDLLLHPSWQRIVVPAIARALPELQFVFTTHSPIVAGTLQAENILLARTGTDGVSAIGPVDADIHGLNAEQILLSSYFELTSTRAPDAQATLTTLAERAINGDDDAAVDYLRTLAAGPGKDENGG